ncbi:hypothetical protein BH18ACT15_BH18ACT15_14780 [soil metagenome]
MRRPRLFSAVVAALVVTAAVVVGPAAMSSAHRVPTTDTNFTNIPVHGHVAGTSKTFRGTMDVKRFAKRDGALYAVGLIDGKMKRGDGSVIGAVDNHRVKLPVTEISTGATTTSGAAAQARTCDVLHLELGPLDLDLLGLVVHLNKVVLDIDAQSGPGNLLGNLVCAIAGLLDPGGGILDGLVGVVQDILNAIVGALKL